MIRRPIHLVALVFAVLTTAAAPSIAAVGRSVPDEDGAPRVGEAAYWFAMGKLLADEAAFDEAREAYEKAVELRETDPYGWLELASFHSYLAQISRDDSARIEHLEEAARHAARARDLAPGEADVLRTFAQIHLRLGEHRPTAVAEARTALEKLRDQGDADLQSLTQLGQIHLWSRDPSAAADVLREAQALQPGHRLVRTMLIDALLAAGRGAEAEEDLAASVAQEPGNLEHRLRWAEVVSERGDHDRALAILTATPEDQADDPRLARLRVRELHLAGRAEDARRVLDGLGPLHADPALTRMAVALHGEQLEYAAARDLLVRLVSSREAGEAELRDVMMLARTRERLGEPEEAVELLRTQLEGRSEEERLQMRLALAGVLERSDRGREALEILAEEAAKAPPELSASLAVARADVLARQAGPDEAAAVLTTTARNLGADERATAVRLELRALEILAEADRWTEVLEGLDQLDEPAEGDPLLLRTRRELRARALASSGDVDAALELLAGDGPEDLGPRAELLLEAGRDEEAQSVLDVLAGQEGGELLAARILQGTERYEEAADRLERLVAGADEAGMQALFLLGAARERLGRFAEAEEAFRRILERSPQHAPTLNYLGYMFADRGERLEEALGLLQRVVALEPDNGAYVDSLGWAYFRLGDLEQARLHLEWAARLVPDDPTVHLHLGDLYRELGETRRARQAWKRAVEIGGEESEPARERLGLE